MSLQSIIFNINASRSDAKRDAAIPIPQGVTQHRDISYYGKGKYGLLDVYYLEGTAKPLPTIVSIHGGGFVYGTKEIYRRYCMDLAKRGFAVVNFNYRLAPRWKFPAPLEDTARVMDWICGNSRKYNLDPQNLFLVGDSAGAQMASQFAAIWSNPEYAKLFSFRIPEIRIRAVGLNCGLYDCKDMANMPRRSIERDYLPRKLLPGDPRLDVLAAVNGNYPPAHITTATHDFLRENARPMAEFLRSKGIEAVCEIYKKADGGELGHVFHVNIPLPEAIACNDSQTAFFLSHLN